MYKIFFLIFLFIFQQVHTQNSDFTQFVNPFIGTGGHGHTFPGATVPFGMVQLSPDTRIDGSWDGCSGYHYSDNVIYGFSHTHLSGTGVSDYGDILLMPTMGTPELDAKNYSSNFQHYNENASAGYYEVQLDKHNINVALTSSKRVGFHQYTFNNDGQANIILDLNHRDKLLDGEVKIIDSKTILVKRRSEAWATNQFIFAIIKFSVPMKLTDMESNGVQDDLRIRTYSGTKLKMAFSKEVKKGEKIWVKVAISMTSYDGAEVNMGELKHWDFEKTKSDAQRAWNEELSKIEVQSDNRDQLTIFYTALYHTMLQPNIANDLDGKYRGRDNMIHTTDGYDYYTVFSLWDTFRATHPLYTLIDKKRTADFVNTFIKQYEQAGRLPVWELSSNETDCMIGYHSVSVIADAMIKEIKGFDYEKAFNAAKKSAMFDHLGLDSFKNYGVITIDDEHESVSKTLEYAYDDWCIAQMATLLNKNEDAQYFNKRAQNWKNIFDWQTGFMRPKKNGGWLNPFDPREVNNHFTEGNSWQYSFFVPHEINSLIKLHGGKNAFEKKLDALFNSESKTTGREQVDITGLIGQYAHGNEPSHHIAYLYNYVDKPEKAKEKVHFILNEFYKNTPDGLIGNEDCGQMSAWYVLSAMGIYNISPGKTTWDVTEPYFDQIIVHLEDGSQRVINKNSSTTDLQNLGFENAKPLTKIEKTEENIYQITPNIISNAMTFTDKMSVKIETIDPTNTTWYWIISDEKPNDKIKILVYDKPFEIDKTCTVYSYTGKSILNISNVAKAKFVKKPNNYSIQLISKYNPQYHAGGSDGLLDGIFGTTNWKKGEWQGFQNQDFEAIVDLKKSMKVKKIMSNYLQDTRSWILMPTQVEYYVSNDNKNFKWVATIQNTLKPEVTDIKIKAFETNFEETEARYIKVIARNFGKLPEWHQGFPYDGMAFIFVDEIVVE